MHYLSPPVGGHRSTLVDFQGRGAHEWGRGSLGRSPKLQKLTDRHEIALIDQFLSGSTTHAATSTRHFRQLRRRAGMAVRRRGESCAHNLRGSCHWRRSSTPRSPQSRDAAVSLQTCCRWGCAQRQCLRHRLPLVSCRRASPSARRARGRSRHRCRADRISHTALKTLVTNEEEAGDRW